MSQVHVRDRADFERREIDSWRSNCERLGASLANKDLEIKALTQKMQHAEKQVFDIKVIPLYIYSGRKRNLYTI